MNNKLIEFNSGQDLGTTKFSSAIVKAKIWQRDNQDKYDVKKVHYQSNKSGSHILFEYQDKNIKIDDDQKRFYVIEQLQLYKEKLHESNMVIEHGVNEDNKKIQKQRLENALIVTEQIEEEISDLIKKMV